LIISRTRDTGRKRMLIWTSFSISKGFVRLELESEVWNWKRNVGGKG